MAAKPFTDMARADVACPGCKKLYDSPKLLPCLHCLCEQCLLKMNECPTCTKKVGDKDRLPNAHFKSKMVTLYKHIEAKEKGCCEECEQKMPKLSFSCSECGFICDGCVQSHKQLRVYRSHKLVDVTKLDRSKSLATLKDANTGRMKCSIHADYTLTKYCKTCKCLICQECTFGHHKQLDHQSVDLTACFATLKDELEKELHSLCDHQTNYHSSISETKRKNEMIGQHEVVMQRMISTSFDEIAAKMKELKNTVLQKLRKEITTAKQQLHTREGDIKKAAAEIDDVVKLTKEYVKHSNDQEFMSVYEQVLTRMYEAKEVKVSDEKTRIMENLSNLLIECEARVMEICHDHLQQNYKLSLDKSKVSELPQQAKVGAQARFIVHAVTESTLPCVQKQKIEVDIKVKRTGEVISSEVNSGRDLGTYIVNFTPTVKGQHAVVVKIDEKEVNGSPFYVNVKPQILKWTKPHDVSKQDAPWGVACAPNGTVYVTLNYQHKIVAINRMGVSQILISTKGHRAGQIWSPTGIAVDKDGSVYVADDARVQKLSSEGQSCAQYKHLSKPAGVMVNDTYVYVCDIASKNGGAIVVLDKKDLSLKHTITQNVQCPHSICGDSNGNIYVSDRGQILIFTRNHDFLRSIKCTDFTPAGICVKDDTIYVCNENQVEFFTTNGKKIETCGKFGKVKLGEFHSPMGIAIDEDNYIYVCDFSNDRVQIF